MSDLRESPLAVVARRQTALPVDLDGIAADLGIRVNRIPLGHEIAGRISRDQNRGGSSGFVIDINSQEHPNRQRFTLAHEIAHFILHRDLIERGIVDDTMYRSDLGSRLETQANRMAADILMPVRLVKAMWANHPSVPALAKAFGVSEAAMKIRIEGIKTNQSDLPF